NAGEIRVRKQISANVLQQSSRNVWLRQINNAQHEEMRNSGRPDDHAAALIEQHGIARFIDEQVVVINGLGHAVASSTTPLLLAQPVQRRIPPITKRERCRS